MDGKMNGTKAQNVQNMKYILEKNHRTLAGYQITGNLGSKTKII